jgi:hypothetical protein
MNAEQTAAPLPALSAAEEPPLSHYEKKGAQGKGQRPERAPGFCAAGAFADNQRLLAGCDSGIVIQEESRRRPENTDSSPLKSRNCLTKQWNPIFAAVLFDIIGDSGRFQIRAHFQGSAVVSDLSRLHSVGGLARGKNPAHWVRTSVVKFAVSEVPHGP